MNRLEESASLLSRSVLERWADNEQIRLAHDVEKCILDNRDCKDNNDVKEEDVKWVREYIKTHFEDATGMMVCPPSAIISFVYNAMEWVREKEKNKK